MIYFVDEDVPYAKEFQIPLIMRGYKVDILPNADLAYDALESSDNIELAVIDIMLATAEKEKSRFGADESAGFLKTGLLLMNFLNSKRPEIFPKRFVVLTAAGDAGLLREIESQCRVMGVPVLRKSHFRKPSALAEKLLGLLR